MNTFADGLFDAAPWSLVLVGTLLMLASWRQNHLAPGWRFQMGLLVAGWGLFNLVEGDADRVAVVFDGRIAELGTHEPTLVRTRKSCQPTAGPWRYEGEEASCGRVRVH